MADDQPVSRRPLRMVSGIVLLLGVIVLPPWPLQAAERPHVSLVEPEKTDCVLCHETLSTVAHHNMGPSGCLECHTFVKNADATVVTVEEIRHSGAPSAEDHPHLAGTAGEKEPTQTDARVGTDPGNHRTAPDAAGDPGTTTGSRDAAPPSTITPNHREQEASLPGEALFNHDQSRSRYATGLAAFRRGELDMAFESWRAMLSSGRELYTVQVEVDRHLTSVQDLFAKYDDHSLYVVVRDEMYWVHAGLFPTRAAAEKAVDLLPEPLRKGGAFPTAVSSIVKER